MRQMMGTNYNQMSWDHTAIRGDDLTRVARTEFAQHNRLVFVLIYLVYYMLQCATSLQKAYFLSV